MTTPTPDNPDNYDQVGIVLFLNFKRKTHKFNQISYIQHVLKFRFQRTCTACSLMKMKLNSNWEPLHPEERDCLVKNFGV